MKNRPRLLIRAAAAILVLIYAALAPVYLLRADSVEPEPQSETPPGIITVWHIVAFKPYSGSVTGWLSKRGAALEKRHYGTFYNVTGMSYEEYVERRARGERADVYSFAAGCMEADMLLPLEADIDALLIPSLSGCGENDGTAYAYAYLYSGYAIAFNSALMQKQGILPPEEGLFEKWAATMLAKGMLSCEPAIASALMIDGDPAAIDAFLQGRCPAAICDMRTLAMLKGRLADGKGFVYQSVAFTDYTEQVQLIGIAADIAPAKLEAALLFISTVFDEAAQSPLCELGAHPALAACTDSAQADLPQETALLLSPLPRVPNAFDPTD